MISFTCPKCKTLLTVDVSQAGSKYACATCGQLMLVPTPAGGSSVRQLRRFLNIRPCPPCPMAPVAATAPSGGRIGLILTLSAVGLVVVGGVVGLLIWAPWSSKTKNSPALSAEAIKFLPDGSQVVGSVDAEGLLKSEAFKKLEMKMASVQGINLKQLEYQVREEVGLGWSDLKGIHFGGKISQRDPDPIVVLTTKEPVNARKILAKSKHGNLFQEEKIGRFTFYKNEQSRRGQPVGGFCVVDDTTIVFGPLEAMRQSLKRDKNPQLSSGLQATTKQVDFSKTVALAVDKIPSEVLDKIPLEITLFFPQLKEYLKKVDGYLLELNASSSIDVKISALCAEGKVAQELADLVTTAKTTAKNFPQIPPQAKEMVNAIKISVSGNTASVSLSVNPDTIIQLMDAWKR